MYIPGAIAEPARRHPPSVQGIASTDGSARVRDPETVRLIHDPVASFYGGYEQVGLVRRARVRVPRLVVLIAVALAVLVLLVAADVAAYESRPVPVEVTTVIWLLGADVLASAPGFATHGGQPILLTLTCEFICYNFVGASVGAPFHLVAFGVTDVPIQFVNVTLETPSSAYTGPIDISLVVP